ncbi:hypothetical protein [Ornithinicoccus halotolerans]|uniref:hypothetical protein n=1 Tax=Ornithinicoccus halotolerans TaxID=1748220 RepID=UPI0012979618|nr:hypothetical protein [Ornithinicoccus halotolerans]
MTETLAVVSPPSPKENEDQGLASLEQQEPSRIVAKWRHSLVSTAGAFGGAGLAHPGHEKG